MKVIANSLFFSFSYALILTIVLETIFFFICGERDRSDLELLVLVNILTNPVVVLLFIVFRQYTKWSIILVISALEIAAIAVEGWLYQKQSKSLSHPYRFALLANGFSFCIGELLNRLL